MIDFDKAKEAEQNIRDDMRNIHVVYQGDAQLDQLDIIMNTLAAAQAEIARLTALSEQKDMAMRLMYRGKYGTLIGVKEGIAAAMKAAKEE